MNFFKNFNLDFSRAAALVAPKMVNFASITRCNVHARDSLPHPAEFFYPYSQSLYGQSVGCTLTSLPNFLIRRLTFLVWRCSYLHSGSQFKFNWIRVQMNHHPLLSTLFSIQLAKTMNELKDLSIAYHFEIHVIILDIRYNSHCITIIKLVFFFCLSRGP